MQSPRFGPMGTPTMTGMCGKGTPNSMRGRSGSISSVGGATSGSVPVNSTSMMPFLTNLSIGSGSPPEMTLDAAAPPNPAPMLGGAAQTTTMTTPGIQTYHASYS